MICLGIEGTAHTISVGVVKKLNKNVRFFPILLRFIDLSMVVFLQGKLLMIMHCMLLI
jgi:tRNA A37 threonylcarbamoyltransferase TsaD